MTELKTLQTKNKLLREQLREKRLTQAVQLHESTWLEPYAELLIRLRQREFQARAPASIHDRRYGRDYPLYQTEMDLGFIRMASRYLCATSNYAIGLLEGLTSYIIGTGCDYDIQVSNPADSPLRDAAQNVIDHFLEMNAWRGGELPSLEEERFVGSCTDGEDILVHFPLSDGTVEVRTFDCEQLKQPPGTRFEEWSFGIFTERDDAHKPLAYWLQHGETLNDGEEYAPDRVVHFRRNVRRSMKRGLPDFSFNTGDALRIAGVLLENMGETGAQQAAIVGVRQHTGATYDGVKGFADQAAQGVQKLDYLTERYGPSPLYRKGRWEDMPDTSQYAKGPLAENSPIHIQILQALLRGAGVRWNAPEWLSSADASNANYSSSLTAESPFVKTGTRRQAALEKIFAISPWYALKHWCTVHGGLQVNGILVPWSAVERNCKLIVKAPSLETRDKLQEAQVLQIERMNGVTSPQTWQALVGRDPDEEQRLNDEWKQNHPDPTPLSVPPGFGESGYGGGQLPTSGKPM